ncbi:MAG TPA: hypothetical protein VHG72_01225 [Polyangia bacterium]|nr:hypothetical protein [Polyangia bacterium]
MKEVFAALRKRLSRSTPFVPSVVEPAMGAESRWPPVYDFEQLTATIRRIVGTQELEKLLYDPSPSRPSFFQGDLIRLAVELPFIGEDGQPKIQDGPPFWAVIGNTCDFDRAIEDVAFTQVVPVWNLGAASRLPEETRVSFRRYRYYTQFYFPPWDAGSDDQVFVADFLRPVTIHKNALRNASVVARLNRVGWILFHACVVRFLARDDGREDQGAA